MRRLHPPTPAGPFPVVIVVILLVWWILGCASGPVRTSTGVLVPAATVVAQDVVADMVSELEVIYRESVARHDALANVEDPARHAKRRASLQAFKAGLQGTTDGLIAWKRGATGAAPATVLAPAVSSVSAFLDAAVDIGAMTNGAAEKIRAFFRAAFPELFPAIRVWGEDATVPAAASAYSKPTILLGGIAR